MNTKSKHQVKSTTFTIEVGQFFRRGPTVFRISEDFGSRLRLEHVVSLESKHIETAELASSYSRGELIPCTKEDAARAISGEVFLEDDGPKVLGNVVSAYGDTAVDYGLKILKYIEELQACGYRNLRPQPLIKLDIEKIAKKIGDEKPPKASTIYKHWLSITRSDGDKRAAIPLYRNRGGRGQPRISLEAIAELQKLATRIKNNKKEKINFRKIESELFHELSILHGNDKAIILKPSLSTVTSVIKSEFSQYEIYARKYGKKEANRKYRNWHPRNRATFPLEVVEFDDKDTRVYAIDERTGLPCGRIYITSGVDQYSTVPIGFSISDKHRDTWSAINAIANSILPKDLTGLDWSEVRSEVPFMGLIGKIVFDNALYNHARNLEEAALEMSNATISWAQPYTPTQKSCVEDFNGCITEDFLINLPGFGGPKVTQDLIKDGISSAILTVQEFRKKFHTWAYDVFCNTPRVGGLTPRQKWESQEMSHRPKLPLDIQRVRIATMFRHTLKLRPGGILFVGLAYNNNWLETYRRNVGYNATVSIRFDPVRLDEIYVLDENIREWFSVPSANPEYTKYLTLAQHKLVRKSAQINGVRNPAVPQLLVARARLAESVAQWTRSSKFRERKLAARVGEIIETQEKSSPETVVVTELESQIMQIESVLIETSDEGWEFPEL